MAVSHIFLPFVTCAIKAAGRIKTNMITASIIDSTFIFATFVTRLVLSLGAIQFSVADFFNGNAHTFTAIELSNWIAWLGNGCFKRAIINSLLIFDCTYKLADSGVFNLLQFNSSLPSAQSARPEQIRCPAIHVLSLHLN